MAKEQTTLQKIWEFVEDHKAKVSLAAVIIIVVIIGIISRCGCG